MIILRLYIFGKKEKSSGVVNLFQYMFSGRKSRFCVVIGDINLAQLDKGVSMGIRHWKDRIFVFVADKYLGGDTLKLQKHAVSPQNLYPLILASIGES